MNDPAKEIGDLADITRRQSVEISRLTKRLREQSDQIDRLVIAITGLKDAILAAAAVDMDEAEAPEPERPNYLARYLSPEDA